MENKQKKVIFCNYQNGEIISPSLSINTDSISCEVFEQFLRRIFEKHFVVNKYFDNKVLNIILYEEGKDKISINLIENSELFDILFWENKTKQMKRIHCIRIFIEPNNVSLVKNITYNNRIKGLYATEVTNIHNIEEIYSLAKEYFSKFDTIVFPYSFYQLIAEELK